MTTGRSGASDTIKYGILAGVAGGLAEIAWILLYANATGSDVAVLARGVTTAAGVIALLPQAPVTMGIALHMILAVTLGIALAGLWQALVRTHVTISLYAVALAALAGVWAMNFFVVLPAISPAFVVLVPYSVSLLSKLMFGLAAAEVLRRCAVAEAARMPLRVRATASTLYPAP
jgi:hypothetical protein